MSNKFNRVDAIPPIITAFHIDCRLLSLSAVTILITSRDGIILTDGGDQEGGTSTFPSKVGARTIECVWPLVAQ